MDQQNYSLKNDLNHDSSIDNNSNIDFKHNKRKYLIQWFISTLNFSDFIKVEYVDYTIFLFDKIPYLMSFNIQINKVILVSILQLVLKLKYGKKDIKDKISSICKIIYEKEHLDIKNYDLNMGEIFICNLLSWSFNLETFTNIFNKCYDYIKYSFKIIEKRDFFLKFRKIMEFIVINYNTNTINKGYEIITAVILIVFDQFQSNIYINNNLIKMIKKLIKNCNVDIELIKFYKEEIIKIIENSNYSINKILLDDRLSVFNFNDNISYDMVTNKYKIFKSNNRYILYNRNEYELDINSLIYISKEYESDNLDA